MEAKEKELKEIYEIQKAASSLTALIETQHRARQQLEAEMAEKKEALNREIESMRAEWNLEKQRREAEIKEQEAAERKRREREKEEFQYEFEREQQVAQDKFQDDQSRMEREIQYKREQMERELAEREQAIARKEEELETLRKKAEAYPKELEAAVDKAVEEAVGRVRQEAKNREDLLKQQFEGERNVLNTRIESLEKTVKEQQEHIGCLAQQAEKAHVQMQNIAMKALEKTPVVQAQAASEPSRRQKNDED